MSQVSRRELESHPYVVRLLGNLNWKPAAEAAIAYVLEGKSCPIASWRKSSSWSQVEAAYNEIKTAKEQNQ